MEVTRALLEKTASLARLSLSDSEISRFIPQLKEILETFSKLDEVDTTHVEPSFHPVMLQDAAREDKPRKCLSQEDALSNVKEHKDGFIKGPKVV